MADTDLLNDIFALALDENDTLGNNNNNNNNNNANAISNKNNNSQRVVINHQPVIMQQPGPPLNWVPPFPGWQWGMPLPPNYPPPPPHIVQQQEQLRQAQIMQHQAMLAQQQ